MRIVFEKRKTISRKAIFLVPLVSFLISLLLTAILLLIFKANPLLTYAAMFQGAFGSWPNFTETLVKATPLMLTGLVVLIAFRLKFWNIGSGLGRIILVSLFTKLDGASLRNYSGNGGRGIMGRHPVPFKGAVKSG